MKDRQSLKKRYNKIDIKDIEIDKLEEYLPDVQMIIAIK